MHSFKLFSTLFSLSSLFAAGSARCNDTSKFKSYGVVLFPAFDLLDVTGPLEILGFVAQSHKIDVAFIAETMSPVSSAPQSSAMNVMNSTAWPSITPTHTFKNAPDYEVMIVVGGLGMRAANLNSTLDYIAKNAPKVKHILTICTGSALAARAGIMNGKKATTNKTSWSGVIQYGPNTTWVPNARWVEDNSGPIPIWSSSGVSSGLDLTFHFVETFYNSTVADKIANITEYVRNKDPMNDPFARNATASTKA